MALNIKNERVQALAREAALRTGKTQTGVIEEALALYLTTVGDPATKGGSLGQRAAEIQRLVGELTVELTEEDRRAIREGLDDLYDDHGLLSASPSPASTRTSLARPTVATVGHRTPGAIELRRLHGLRARRADR